MRILVINPVGHSTWNEADKALYERFLPLDIEVDVMSLPRGPPTVETVEAYLEASRLVVEVGRTVVSKYNGIIINCFLDPGVEELRRETKSIVLGTGESSLTLANLYGRPIYVLTVSLSKETLDLMRNKIHRFNLGEYLVGIVSVPIRVTDIDKDRNRASELLLNTMKIILSKESRAVFVLGCTGFGGMAEELEDEIKIPVVDPVKASALLITSLLKLTKHHI
ncbi:MAG: aspartate/glutamate racemase family protein [Desulfurococcaceae archaeon]